MNHRAMNHRSIWTPSLNSVFAILPVLLLSGSICMGSVCASSVCAAQAVTEPPPAPVRQARPPLTPRQTAKAAAKNTAQPATKTPAQTSTPFEAPAAGTGTTAGRSALTSNGAAASTGRQPLSAMRSASNTANNGRTATNSATNTSGAANNRTALNTSDEGLGSFNASGYTLTAYSCFRSGAHVLCDSDVSNQGNVQVNAKAVFREIRMVNSAGRIFPRTDAYFVDTDGSQFATSQITPGNKVRLAMVFDNLPTSTTSVTLAYGRTTLQNVEISAQEPGTTGEENASTAAKPASTAKTSGKATPK